MGLLDERGKMMQDWADYLTAVTDREKIDIGNFDSDKTFGRSRASK
jgi:hypothetical protein